MNKENFPLISIIIPVYKAESCLHRCIDSLLAQTFINFEILLINDGSPDCSGEICDQYAARDHRIRVFHKKNGGVSSARNKGIEEASGKWICFIDADDYVRRDYLETFAPQTAQMDSLIVQRGYNLERIDNETSDFRGVPVEKYSDELSSKDVFLYSEIYHTLNSPCFKLFDRQIINNNDCRFDVRYNIGEDHLFVLTYLQHCRNMKMVDACGYCYVKENNSESLTSRYKSFDELYGVFTNIYHRRLQLIDYFDISNADYIEFIKQEYRSYLWVALRSMFIPQERATLPKFERKKNYAIIKNMMKQENLAHVSYSVKSGKPYGDPYQKFYAKILSCPFCLANVLFRFIESVRHVLSIIKHK